MISSSDLTFIYCNLCLRRLHIQVLTILLRSTFPRLNSVTICRSSAPILSNGLTPRSSLLRPQGNATGESRPLWISSSVSFHTRVTTSGSSVWGSICTEEEVNQSMLCDLSGGPAVLPVATWTSSSLCQPQGCGSCLGNNEHGSIVADHSWFFK